MSEKINRRVFIGELFIIVLPLALLLLSATLVQLVNTIEFFDWLNIVIFSFALVACTAVTSGLLISRAFIQLGSSSLRDVKLILWIFLFLGAILCFAAIISKLLPPPPEYSTEEMFRDNLEFFALGLPMFIPFFHLIVERYLRKEEQISTDSKTLSVA